MQCVNSWRANNIGQNNQNYSNLKNSTRNAGKIDKILIDASIYAEQKCKRRNRIWWLLLLDQAKFMLNTL